MTETFLNNAGGNEGDERRDIIRSLCKRYMKGIILCGYNWRNLSAFANRAYERAVRAFDRKDYQEFELNLLLYSDVWLYANAHLKPRDFQYFCHGQYKTSAPEGGILC